MKNPNVTPPSPPRSRLRLGRIFAALIVLAALAGGAYLAAWLNARRFYVVVEETRVRIGQGRMFPFGWEPLVPNDPALRRAYESFSLPGGMKLPRGETVYTERVELDQALYRLLEDAAQFTLTADNRRTPGLVRRYLEQLRALPGLTAVQQRAIVELERDADFVGARALAAEATAQLAEAAALYRSAARGSSGRHPDAEARAAHLEQSLRVLRGDVPPAFSPAQVGTSSVAVPVRDRAEDASPSVLDAGARPDGSADVDGTLAPSGRSWDAGGPR